MVLEYWDILELPSEDSRTLRDRVFLEIDPIDHTVNPDSDGEKDWDFVLTQHPRPRDPSALR